MNSENFNSKPPATVKSLRKIRILVAPLDWGLGHATRCVPVIRELLSAGAEVWLAGEHQQEAFFSAEFPDLSFLPLRGYRVSYAGGNWSTVAKLLWQSPGILRTIRYENEWLRTAVAEHGFDAVISDNRYGLHHSAIPSIFISHQLQIASPFGKWTEAMLRKRNYRFIDRFTECWVPDEPGDQNAGGRLSHPDRLPRIPLHYIGLLSRFERGSLPKPQAGRLLALLSGPEPQRSLLEKKLRVQLQDFSGTALIVQGLPEQPSTPVTTSSLQVYSHLPEKDLRAEIGKAEWIIARSGYTTIMELLSLRKKAILIPTPGQSEQQYLARHLENQLLACTVSQNGFSLQDALRKGQNFDYRLFPLTGTTTLQKNIDRLLSSLRKD